VYLNLNIENKKEPMVLSPGRKNEKQAEDDQDKTTKHEVRPARGVVLKSPHAAGRDSIGTQKMIHNNDFVIKNFSISI